MSRPVVLRFLGDTTSLDQAFRRLRAESAAASASTAAAWKRTGESITSVGKSITRNLSAPALLAAGYATKLALDFDASMLKIRTLVGASAEQVNAWRGDVLDMSRVLPQSADELARALYFITSSGIPATKAMDVLNHTARAAASGLGETQILADLATSAINAYGPANLNAAQTMDVLIAAIREGKAEPEEFAASLGRVISPAQNLGISFDQVTGAMSAMSLVGINADEAATALRSTMMSILKPAAEQVEAAKAIGLSYDDIRKSVRERGLLATLTDLRDRIGDDEEAIGKLFPNVRALNGVLAITGENMENTNRIMGATANSAGGVNTAFGIASEGAKFKLNAALSSLQATMIQIGAHIVPMVVASMESMARVMDWLGDQPAWAHELVAHLLLFVGTTGPAIFAVGRLASAIGAIIGAVGPVLGALAKFGSILARIWRVMKVVLWVVRVLGIALLAGISTPVLIVVGVIALLVAAFVIAWKNSEKFRNIVNGALSAVADAARAVGRWFVDLGQSIWDALQRAAVVVATVAARVWTAMQSIWNAVFPVLQRVASIFTTVFTAIWNVVQVAMKVVFYAIVIPLIAVGIVVIETLNFIWAVFARVLGLVASVVVTYLGIVWTVWSTIFQAVWDVTVTVWNAISSAISTAITLIRTAITVGLIVIQAVWGAVWNAVVSVVLSVWNAIRGAVSAGVNAVRGAVSAGLNAVRSIFTSIWNALPSPVRNAMSSIGDLVRRGIDAVFSTVKSLGSRITGIAGGLFNGIKSAFRSAINSVLRQWNNLTLSVPKVEVMGKEVFGGASIGTPNVPLLANGAIVDSPTLAVIGEAGREIVLPVTRPARAMELLEESGFLGRLAGDRSTAAGAGDSLTVKSGAVQVTIDGRADAETERRVKRAVTDAFGELVDEIRAG